MHLFLGLSGADHIMEIVKKNLSSQAFWTERTNMMTGKREPYKVQGVWRPVEFGHYVFPEECLNQVLTMLSITPKTMNEFESVPHKDKYLMVMRKLLNLKKIPDLATLPALTPQQVADRTIFWHEHLNIIPIGIKEDTKGIRKFADGLIYDQEHL